MILHKCPVCEGRGTVPVGFYAGIHTVSSTDRPTCLSCYGRGFIQTPTEAAAYPGLPSHPWPVNAPKITWTINPNDVDRGGI